MPRPSWVTNYEVLSASEVYRARVAAREEEETRNNRVFNHYGRTVSGTLADLLQDPRPSTNNRIPPRRTAQRSRRTPPPYYIDNRYSDSWVETAVYDAPRRRENHIDTYNLISLQI